jgi:hypothetical protein
MIGAVNQHAADTGLSHLADRYFLRALHRGWLLHGKHSSPTRCQTPGVRAGPAELDARGRNGSAVAKDTDDSDRRECAIA